MKKHITEIYHSTYQLKLPVEIEKIIEISDPVYTFCEVMEHIDLKKYLAVKESKTGRKRYDSEILLKVILFAFMERWYVSVRAIEKLCKTDIRFMWLLNDHPSPSHMTITNFMNECLLENIEDIFVTFPVSKSLTSRLVKLLQPENIEDILITFAVLKPLTSRLVRLLQLENI